jgi:hypothetical protein
MQVSVAYPAQDGHVLAPLISQRSVMPMVDMQRTASLPRYAVAALAPIASGNEEHAAASTPILAARVDAVKRAQATFLGPTEALAPGHESGAQLLDEPCLDYWSLRDHSAH